MLTDIERRDSLSRLDFGLVARLADNNPSLKEINLHKMKNNRTREIKIN
jgi:hypothetical protein